MCNIVVFADLDERVIDPLLPDPEHVAFACPDCGAIFEGSP